MTPLVIYIDKSIGAHGQKHPFTEDELVLFSELALAHRNGRCLLCGEIASIECIMKRIGGWQRDLYKRVRNHYTQMRSIITLVETMIVLSYDDQPDVPSFIAHKYILIKMNEASNVNLSTSCVLIGENLDDCKFYKLIASWYTKRQNIKGVSISFCDEQGGGATTNKVFENCVLINHTPSLCIVDTDVKFGKTVKYPQDPALGDTAKKALATYKTLQQNGVVPIFDLLCIPVHEVENLIPASIIVELSSAPQDMEKYLKDLLTIDNGKPILYYDFKEGDKKLKKDQAIEYWYEISEKTGNYSFPCACQNVLPKAVELLQKHGENGLQRLYTVCVDSYLISFWSSIGKKVFSWGCASDKVLA